jgi:hypothetical protein
MSIFQLKSTIFTLPSLGTAYDLKSIKLINGDSVKLRPFVAGDLRTFKSSNDSYKMYVNFLSKLIVEPEKLNYDDLLLSDVVAILFATRLMSFGPSYGILYACESCGERNREEVDLSAIPVKYANEFSFTPNDLQLELGEYTVTTHLARLKDEKFLAAQMQNLKRANLIQDEDLDKSYMRIAILIDTINGEPSTSPMRNFDFVNNLPIQCIKEYNDAVSEADSGIVPKIFASCSSCGFDNEIIVSMGSEFFRMGSKPS